MITPINGVVALKIAEYPAGRTCAARQYINTGMPEFTTPISSALRRRPRKSHALRMSSRMTARPMDDSSTRAKAVGMAPISGTSWRMNRKLAPQMAARLSSLSREEGFIDSPPGGGSG
ncbi:hypothetical protein D3C81_699290 [compost metagenome]